MFTIIYLSVGAKLGRGYVISCAAFVDEDSLKGADLESGGSIVQLKDERLFGFGRESNPRPTTTLASLPHGVALQWGGGGMSNGLMRESPEASPLTYLSSILRQKLLGWLVTNTPPPVRLSTNLGQRLNGVTVGSAKLAFRGYKTTLLAGKQCPGYTSRIWIYTHTHTHEHPHLHPHPHTHTHTNTHPHSPTHTHEHTRTDTPWRYQ